MPRERIVIEDDSLDRLFVQTEPANDLVFAGTGPERGEWEEAVRGEVEYIPPARSAEV